MNTYELLEFTRIRDECASYASCEETRERLRRSEPILDATALADEKRYVGAFLRRIDEGAAIPRGEVVELDRLFDYVRREGAVLEADALYDVRRFLDYAAEMRAFLAADEEEVLA